MCLADFLRWVDWDSFCGSLPVKVDVSQSFIKGGGNFLLSEDTQRAYSGVDILETLREAANYNRFLACLVGERSQPEDLIVDFGAGTGTFAKLIQAADRQVVCVEVDPTLRHRLNDCGLLAYRLLDGVSGRLSPSTVS